MTTEDFRELCLTMPDAEEQMHFDKPSYRWKGKIFATLHHDTKRGVLKFNTEQQVEFAERDSKTFYTVQGGWGRQGYTYVELQTVKKKDIEEAVKISFANVSTKKKK
ncbi:MAG: MmcQ/YjbR family DNA-binding protein [Flavobacteriales bacterium]